MRKHLAPLVIHVGYPKTATTTYQQNVFPYHPEIDYLGKFIPSFRYRDEATYAQIEALVCNNDLHPPDLAPLREYVGNVRKQTSRKVVLISSESLIHPEATDVATVVKRLNAALSPCHIWITIREQVSLMLSFYWMHGRHGQYLSIGGLSDEEKLTFPLTFYQWLEFQQRAPDKNLIGILNYYEVISYFKNVFGSKNVSVLVYETLQQSPALFAAQVSSLLGVDQDTTMALAHEKRENSSKGRTTPWRACDGRVFRNQAAGGWLRNLFRCSREREYSENAIVELRNVFRRGNNLLASELGLPLGPLGYSIG